jgi:uncharacterized protein (TIGR03067 family)
MFRFCTTTLAGVLFVAALFPCVAGAADKTPPATELQGRWKLDPASNSELKGDPDQPNQVSLVFEADSWKLTVVNEGGTQEVVGGYFVDPKQTPKILDVTVRGDAETTEIFAIYELQKDKLTVGWRPDGVRPGDLMGTVTDGLIKVTFVRESDG